MRKLILWALVAVVAVVGFAAVPAQAKEPTLQPFEGKTALERRRGGHRGFRGPRRGGFYFGGGWGGWGGPRYRPYHYYRPGPRVIVVPGPTYVYGGSASCY